MIASVLRREIESYAGRVHQRNALYRGARDGSLTRAHIAVYLFNVQHLVDHTEPHLARARERALDAGDQRLAAHYAQKYDEEAGHGAWAARDLDSVADAAKEPQVVLETMRRITAYVARIIDEDPTLYLAYIFFVEYLLVLTGDEFLTMLEERCGIPRASMTVLANHVELDRAHVREGSDVIDALARDPEDPSRMLRVVLDSIFLFEQFAAEVADGAPDGDPAPSLSRQLWDLSWDRHLPWTFDDVTVEAAPFDDALPFIQAHYPRIFAGQQRFLHEEMSPMKRRFSARMDTFLFRAGDATVGVLLAHPSDWTTYYARSVAVLPAHRGKQLLVRTMRRWYEHLASAGVERVECDCSATNLAQLRRMAQEGFVTTGTLSTERWGLLVRLTKFLRPEAAAVFARQFSSSIPPSRRGS